MAYGKDPTQRGSGGSFRQRAGQHDDRKSKARRGRGGGGGLYWADQYKPPTHDVDMIRVLEQNFTVQQVTGEGQLAKVINVDLPFFPYSEHYDGREGKSAICSAGPWAGFRDKSDPCHGCEIFWAGMERDANGKKKQGRMSRREMNAFSLLDYGVYHHVEQVDFKTGQIRVNEQTNQPWMEWKKCEGHGCVACRSGKETRRGMTRHMGLGWGHYNTLLDADKLIGKSCVNCRQRDCINAIAWVCAACGDAIVDFRTTSLKLDEIDKLVSKTVRCPCGHDGFPMEIMECMHCSPAGGSAKRATIFDVDMNIKRVESSDGNQTTLSISQWSEPRPIDPNFAQFAKPIDLAAKYTPTPLDKQKELFKVPAGGIQRAPVTSADATRPYAQNGPGPSPFGQQPQQPIPPPPPMAAPPMAVPQQFGVPPQQPQPQAPQQPAFGLPPPGFPPPGGGFGGLPPPQ